MKSREQQGFWILPKRIASLKTLSDGSKFIYSIIWTRRNGDNIAWPSREYMADCCGKSIKSVDRHLRELKDGKYIISIQRGLRRSNIYRFPEQSDSSTLEPPNPTVPIVRDYNEEIILSKDSIADQPKSADGQANKKEDKLKPHKELIGWAAERRGGLFPNFGKQLKAINMIKKAGISPREIKERWLEMEEDKYWQEHGFDFMNVTNSFNKKR